MSDHVTTIAVLCSVAGLLIGGALGFMFAGLCMMQKIGELPDCESDRP